MHNMLKCHADSLQIMTDYYRKDPEVIAFIFGGSVAKGEARPDSDLDGMLIVTDEAYARRQQAGALAECIDGLCTYPEGYFDVKFFNKEYLQAAAEKGSDPTRNSFVGAQVIFSADPDIAGLVAKIPVYPSAQKQERIALFHSILKYAGGYFYNDALRSGDKYMLDKCCFEVVYAGLRMLYAYNEAFFPSHKRFLEYAQRLPHKPDGIVDMAKAVNEKKDPACVKAFTDAILGFTDWGIAPGGAVHTYVKNMEQGWQCCHGNVYEL